MYGIAFIAAVFLFPITAVAQHLRPDAAVPARRDEDSAAIQRLQPLARAGDVGAALLLGRMHAEGRGVPASREAGLAVLRRAALTAEPDALAYVGFRFLFDDAFPGRDPAEARRWFAAAAQRGSAQAALGLGLLYKHGLGVTRSDSTAAAWFRQAADRGLPAAGLMLASLHDNPSSPLFDRDAAEQRFRSLEREGGAGLIQAWAEAYERGAVDGYPVPADLAEASRLRRRGLRVASAGRDATWGTGSKP